MTRRVFFVTLLTVTTAKPAAAAGVHVTGPLTASDTERVEGYYQLGRELMIAVHPKSVLKRDLDSMLDQQVRFSLVSL